MKHPLLHSLVIIGGLLVTAPVLHSQWQLHRVAAFYEQRGEGSTLPPELKPRPYAGYDWACFGAGLSLVVVSLWTGRSPAAGKSAPARP